MQNDTYDDEYSTDVVKYSRLHPNYCNVLYSIRNDRSTYLLILYIYAFYKCLYFNCFDVFNVNSSTARSNTFIQQLYKETSDFLTPRRLC